MLQTLCLRIVILAYPHCLCFINKIAASENNFGMSTFDEVIYDKRTKNSLRPGLPMAVTLRVILCNCFCSAPSTHYFGRAWPRENGLAPPSPGCATQILRVHLRSCSCVQPLQGHESLKMALWALKRTTEQMVRLVKTFLRISSR